MFSGETSPFTVNQDSKSAVIATALKNKQYDNLKCFIDSAFECRFLLTKEEYETLIQIMGRIPVVFKPGDELKVNSHPVAACLNAYAYKFCIKEAELFTTAIDIGGNPVRSGNNHHVCALVNDSKSDARYVEASFILSRFNQKLSYDQQGFMEYLAEDKPICLRGAENCNFQAKYAYAVNVYDIEFEKIPVIFEKHGLVCLDMWMFLPTSLVDTALNGDDKLYNVSHEDGKSYFHLHDGSDMYIHDTDNWRKYLTVCTITDGERSINVEHRYSMGTFTHIRFTLSDQPPALKRRFYPASRLCTTVAVPNIVEYTNCTNQTRVPSYITAPTVYVNKLRKWGFAAGENQFTTSAFFAYANSNATSVRFQQGSQQELVYEGVDITHDLYHQLIISLFTLTAINRLERTQVIAANMKELKSITEDQGFVASRLNSIKAEVLAYATEMGYRKHGFERFEFYRLVNLKIKVPRDVYFNEVVHAPIPIRKRTIGTNQSKLLRSTYDGEPPKEPAKSNATTKEDDTLKISNNHKHEQNPTIIEEIPGDDDMEDYIEDEVVNPTGNHNNDSEPPVDTKQLVDPQHFMVRMRDNKFQSVLNTVHEEQDYTLCNTAVIYDPPGDGKCAQHIIKHYDHTYKITGEDMWSFKEFAAAANKHNITFDYHENGEFICRHPSSGSTHISVDLSNGHWRVVSCGTEAHAPAFVGDYCTIKPNLDDIYVNCANVNCSDGAGQAKAFRQLFPNYDNRLAKPINDAQPLEYKGHHLFLAVAHRSETGKDYNQIHEKLHNIFSALEKYANDTRNNGSTGVVMLPIIGCGIFRNPLCCFRTVLANYTFKHRLCFLNNAQYASYCKTLECRHGGYKTVKRGRISAEKVVETPEYHKLVDSLGQPRMDLKFKDIIAVYTAERGVTPEHIYDISAAPGHFYRVWSSTSCYVDQYTCAVYTGKNALEPQILDSLKAKYLSYNKLDEVPSINCDLVLYDMHLDCDTLREVMRIAGNMPFISKVNPMHDDYQSIFNTLTNAGYYVHVARSEGSRNTSGELYIYCLASSKKQTITTMTSDDVNNTTLEMGFQRLAQDVCNCDHSKRPSGNAFVSFKNNLNGHIIKMDTIIAAPGARKTTTIKANFCHKCTLIVSPFKAVAGDVGRMACVIDVAKDRRDGKKFVILDEIFSWTKQQVDDIYMWGLPMLAMGDDDQCWSVDYNSECYTISFEYKEGQDKKWDTWRIPQSFKSFIARPLICHSKKKGKVSFKPITALRDIKNDEHNIIVCFTQKIKEQLKDLNHAPVITAHASGGITRDIVHIYMPDLQQIRQFQFKYLYTAVSRSCNELVIYGDNEDREAFYTILNTPIERALDAFGVTPVSVIKVTDDIVNNPHHHDSTILRCETADLAGVENILDKCFIASNDTSTDVIGYCTNVIPENPDGKKFRLEDLPPGSDVVMRGKRIGTRMWQQMYHGKSQKHTIDCMLLRYAKKSKQIDHKYLEKYLKGFAKFIKPGAYERIAALCTPDALFIAVTEYLEALQLKLPHLKDEIELFRWDGDLGGENGDYYIRKIITLIQANKPNKITDLSTEWYEKMHGSVSFHLKRQPKEIRAPGYDAVEKAGQGIAAWTKLNNCIFSAFTRFFDKEIKNELQPWVQLSYGKSDAELSRDFNHLGRQLNSKQYTKFSADFSEFDSSQEKQGILSSIMILKACGIPKKMREYYLNMRREWVMQSSQEDFFATLNVSWKQCSGQPFTLAGNTMFNMTAIGACYDFDPPAIAAFKGDDSFILTTRIDATLDGENTLIKTLDYKIKDVRLGIAEYIANIITPHGTFFPDVVRRVGRMLSKIHSNDVDWAEQRQSLADSLDVIMNVTEQEIGCEVAARYYRQLNMPITAADVKCLLTFMQEYRDKSSIDELPTRDFRIKHIEI